MIIERLEFELSAAEQRLDRTIEMVASPTDPEAVHARKTVETLADLLARIDVLLSQAVDRFPSAFDFSNVKGPSAGANQPAPEPHKSGQRIRRHAL